MSDPKSLTRQCIQRKGISRRRFFAVPGLLAISRSREASSLTSRSAQIGVLSFGNNEPKVYQRLTSLLQDLVPEFGLTVISRQAGFSQEQLAAQLEELLAQRLDALICLDLFTANYAKARRQGMAPPIVFLVHADPLASHLIQAYSKPGNNLTGVTTYRCVDGKLVEILADAFPTRKRFGYFLDSSTEDDKDCIRLAHEAAVRGRIELVEIDVSAPNFVARLSTTLSALHLDALVAPASAPTWQNRKAVVDVVDTQRLPAIYESTLFLDEGGLMSYGSIASDSIAQVARTAGKILRGERAGEIPVDQPTLFELTINLRAQHAGEYGIKAATLRRADRILE